MTDFLTRLDAIQPAPTPIPSHDEAAVATLDARFLQHVADRQVARDALTALATTSTWLDDRRTDLLKELAETDEKARDTLKHDVIEHFERHHGLQLHASFELRDELANVPNEQLTSRVLAWVTERLGGRSLLDVATDTLRDAFARRVYRPKRQRRHLTLGGYLYVEDDYGGGKRLSWSSREDLGKLATVLHRFEHDEIITMSSLHHALHQVADFHNKTSFGEPISTFNPRCTTITLYRNGNVRLGFVDDATAAAFVALYGLKLVD